MGKMKRMYQKADAWVKKNKPLLRKIGSGIDKYAGKAIGAGEMIESAAPYTGAFAPYVGGFGAALATGGAVAKGAKALVDNAPKVYRRNKDTFHQATKAARYVRPLLTGAHPTTNLTFA